MVEVFQKDIISNRLHGTLRHRKSTAVTTFYIAPASKLTLE